MKITEIGRRVFILKSGIGDDYLRCVWCFMRCVRDVEGFKMNRKQEKEE